MNNPTGPFVIGFTYVGCSNVPVSDTLGVRWKSVAQLSGTAVVVVIWRAAHHAAESKC